VIAVCALVTAASAGSAASATVAFTPGSPGLGDPFFPRSGNGGYDVSHYDLDLTYFPNLDRLVATATIRATATQDLSRFDLDYRGPSIYRVSVDGEPAEFTRRGIELVVEPASGIANGSAFEVVVSYRGSPHEITDPDGSIEGWVQTNDGAFVVGEPRGSPTWFPCNDHPTDKASYAISITVPRGTEAVANGALQGRTPSRRRRGTEMVTWNYVAAEPMASYLATATVGQFSIDRTRVAGLGSLVAIDPLEDTGPRTSRRLRRSFHRSDEIITLFSGLFGAYPFTQTGAIVDHAPQVGYALETQTRPIYDGAPAETTVAHELAHQWFGDSVSLERWQDMWLNEGFATWAQWRWQQEAGGPTTAQALSNLEAQPPSRTDLWEPPPAAIPTPAELFSTSVYTRGAMALEALRQRVGSPTFYNILRAWTAEHAYSNATTADFIALSEAQSGVPLDDLFDRYLFEHGKP
jgi:aminopeptidase N